MKRYLAIGILALLSVLLVVPFAVGQVDSGWVIGPNWQLPSTDNIAYVSFSIGEGGLLWVNNTVVTNMTGVWVDYGSTIVLAATPTNANYSFSSFSLNGTTVFDNPFVYTVVFPTNASSIDVGASFVAEAVPTPSPVPDVTADDAVGLAVALGLIALVCGVGIALYLFYLRNQDEP